MSITRFIASISFIFLFFVCFSAANACTGIQLKAKDGANINGRTVEFGLDLKITGLIIPRNYELSGTLPDGKTGMLYHTKYAAIGGNTFDYPAILDGLNEKGLSIGAFYFPGYATYSTITPQNKKYALSAIEFPNWILTQFATVDEVKNGIKSVVIAPTIPKGWPTLPPFHYIVYDKSGNSIVIEPINGELKVYNNSIGVLTNSPTFDWHLTNLANYINLSPNNISTITLDGMQIKQFGQGSGMHGLPGDFTPPSRFVRATIFSSAAIQSDTALHTVYQVFHILNQFDIPVGVVRNISDNKMTPEYTLATTVKDPQNLIYYFRTFADQTIKMINLNKFDLNAKTLKTFSMDSTQPIIDISMTVK